MVLYLSILFVISIFYLFFRNKNKIMVAFFISFFSSILPTIRSIEVGTDTNAYINMFSNRQSLGDWLSQGTELGFALSVKILQTININDYWVYFFFYSMIFNFLVINFILKQSNYRYLALISFFTFSTIYLIQFNILRQALALAFFCHAIPYLFSEKYIKYYLTVVLASLFHNSAIILFIFPFLYKLSNKKIKHLLIFLPFFVFLFSFFYKEIVSHYALISGFSRYEYYLDKVEEKGVGSTLMFFEYVFIFLILSIFFKRINLKYDEVHFKFWYLMFYISLLFNFSILFMGLPYEGPGRVLIYFMVSYLFVLGYIVKIFNYSHRLYVQMIMVMIMVLQFILVFSFTTYHGVFPYKINSQFNIFG